jgi:transposase-like protein
LPSDSASIPGCPDWTALARDYAENALSVAEICALHGISSRTLYRRARIEGWLLRRPAQSKVSSRALTDAVGPGGVASESVTDAPIQVDDGQGAQITAPPKSPARTTPATRRKQTASATRAKQAKPPIAKRLLTALEKKMSDIESRLVNASAASATDSARDARTLSTLVTLFEKIERHGAKSASRAEQSLSGVPIIGEGLNADRIREDLARRLEALRSGLAGEACAAWDEAIANPVPPGAWASRALGLRGDRSRPG